MISILMTSFALTAPIPAIDAVKLKKEQEAAWVDLASKDEKVATRAVLVLSNQPSHIIPFLKGVMKPLKIDEKSVKKMIADLSSEDEKVWRPAFETFEYLDPRIALELGKCFDETKPGPGQQRLIMVLSDFPAGHFDSFECKFQNNNTFTSENGSSWWAEFKVSQIGVRCGMTKRQWKRAERAIVILEYFGTKEAIDILKTMATGHPEAGPTVAAKEALKRLKAE